MNGDDWVKIITAVSALVGAITGGIVLIIQAIKWGRAKETGAIVKEINNKVPQLLKDIKDKVP